MFNTTSIQFVPYTNQQDVIVFQQGSGVCKSYVGKIGGAQPIWISPQCGPKEIAHEIMHALGFIHEQNRADRDGFVYVNFEHIQDDYRRNFERLPDDFMQISGLTGFDFNSLMIYHPSAFSKNDQPTMQPKNNSYEISPGTQLSDFDIERINRAYSY
jgi:hypothetical protein